MNTIYEQVKAHLESSDKARIFIAVQGGYKSPVFSSKDLPKIKAEGSGLRIGKLFVFACQVKLARVA